MSPGARGGPVIDLSAAVAVAEGVSANALQKIADYSKAEVSAQTTWQ